MLADLTPLENHPAHACDLVRGVSFGARRDAAGLALCYALRGDPAELELSRERGGKRRDELWTKTCFELFLRADDREEYVEFNFSPNGDWAAYHFSGYRSEMQDLACAAPQIETQVTADGLTVSVHAELPASIKAGRLALGPAAIIDTRHGVRSYWALHQPAAKPDFHHSKNFKLSLD